MTGEAFSAHIPCMFCFKIHTISRDSFNISVSDTSEVGRVARPGSGGARTHNPAPAQSTVWSGQCEHPKPLGHPTPNLQYERMSWIGILSNRTDWIPVKPACLLFIKLQPWINFVTVTKLSILTTLRYTRPPYPPLCLKLGHLNKPVRHT